MGDPRRRTFEDEWSELGAGGGAAPSFEDEWGALSGEADMMDRFAGGQPDADGFKPFDPATHPSRYILDTSTPAGHAEYERMAAPPKPADTAGGYARAAAVNFGQGLAAGTLDDAAGVIGGALGMGRGESLHRAQAEEAALDEQYPITSGVSQFAGSMASPLGKIKKLGSVGSAALQSAIEGAGATEDPLANPGEAGLAAGFGAGIGGVAGKVGDVLGDAGGKVYQWGREALRDAVPGLRDTADRQLLAQAGWMAGDFRKARAKGRTPEQYAEVARRTGMGGDGMLPGTLDDYAEGSQLAVDDMEAIRQGVLQSNPGVTVDPNDLAARTMGLQASYAPGAGNNELRDAIGDVARENFQTMPRDAAGQVPWDAVNNVRKTWGKGTNFASGTPRAGVRRDIYGALNDSLEGGLAQADPSGAQAWRQAGRDESYALDMQDIALRRQDQLGKNRLISPSDYATGLGGAGLAGYGAYQQSDGNPYVAAGAAALGGIALNQTIRGREHGWASAGASKLADAFEALPAQTGGADLMQRFASGGAATTTRRAEESINEGRGHMLAEVVQDALQNEPQSLGPYAQQFAEAMGSRQTGAVSALLSRLSQTDPTWRTQYLPALRARTGGDNGF